MRIRSDRLATGPRARWRTVVVAAMVVASSTLAASGPAGADEVADLEAQAREIATTLMDLELEVAQLGEQFNQAQVRLAQLDERTADTQTKLDEARRDEARRRDDLSRYALAAYVGTDGEATVPLALDGRQWDLARRDGYVSSAIGDRAQLVDDLLAAQAIADDLLGDLERSQTETEALTDELDAAQRRAARLMDEQRALQESIQGDLVDAVARQQAELQAQAQAEAQARMEATFGPMGDAGPTPAGDPTTTEGAAPTSGAPEAAPTTAPASTGGGSGGASTTSTVPPTTPGGTTPSATAPPATQPPPTAPPTTVPPVVTPPPPASGKGQIAANAALGQLGVAYSWGGGTAHGPSYGFGQGAGIRGFDCSGLTLYAWAQAGVYLYHSAQMQYDRSRKVPVSHLAVGDLVFYGASSSTISHVALYIGNGQVVHAPNARTVVQTGPVYLWNGYYPWVGAGRPG